MNRSKEEKNEPGLCKRDEQRAGYLGRMTVLGPLSKKSQLSPSLSVNTQMQKSQNEQSKKTKANKKKKEREPSREETELKSMRQEDSNQTDMGSTSTVFEGDQENGTRKSEAIQEDEGTNPESSTQREFSGSEESQRPPECKTGVTQEDKVHHPEEEVVSMTWQTSNKPEKTSVLARLTKADKATLKALIKISNLTGGDEEVAHQIEVILSEQARLKNLVMEQAQELAFQKGRIEELEKRKVELEQSSTEKEDPTNHGQREGASTQGNPKPTYAVIVTSSSLQKKEVAELIKKKVDPLHTGIEDAQMRPGREGIVMTTSSKEASDKLMRILEKDKDLRPLTVKQPKQNRLQVKVVGVEEELDIETLPERIIAQNRLNCSTDDIMVKKTWDGKNGKTVILGLNRKGVDAMGPRKALNIGWTRCPVYDHIFLPRCTKCAAYGHTAFECDGPLRCANCGKNGHRHQDCDTEAHCRICSLEGLEDTEHSMMAWECPTYVEKLQSEKRRILSRLC